MSDLKKRAVPILIGSYQIDAAISESHQFESDITEFPVEQGSAISDNIQSKAIMVTIEGIVSDTPIGLIATLRNQQAASSDFLPVSDPKQALAAVQGSTFLPSVDARTALLAIRDARVPITIATSIRTYENMALQSLTIPVDASTGAALRFTAVFKQIIIVTNLRTTVRTTVLRTASPSGQPKKNKGKWATKFGIDGIYVVTYPIAVRATVSKTFGQPILTDTSDHYKVDDNSDTKPDGYIGTDNKYHPITAVGGSSTNVGTTIGGRPVSYQYGIRNADGTYTHSGGAWVDSQNGAIVKNVPAGASNEQKFSGVIFGKNPPGL